MARIKDFIGETLIYGFANAFSRAFAMLLIPLYVKLGKDGYSNLFMLQSGFTVLTFMLALNTGIFYYYYRWTRVRFRRLIFTSWFYYQIAIASIFLLILVVFSENIVSLFVNNDSNTRELQIAIPLMALQFFPYIINNTNINYFRIRREPKKVLYLVLLKSLFILITVGVGLTYFDFGIIEVVLVQLLSRLAVSLLFIKTASNYLYWKNFSTKVLKMLLSFSWPFFIISAFSWAIISIDKFIGAGVLSNKEEIALLALATQLSTPIVVLADMIRMAIAPFVMSIHREKDAHESYQQVFDLSVASGYAVLIGIIAISPILTITLTNASYLDAIVVLPMIGMSSILTMISTQFSISFSLENKNVYLLIGNISAGIIVVGINILFMKSYGYVVAGISQFCSTLAMVLILYFMGKRIAGLQLKVKNALIFSAIVLAYIVYIYTNLARILDGNFWELFFVGLITFILLAATYLKLRKSTKQAEKS